MDYDPKDADNVWPAGEYDGVLKTVVDGFSKTSGRQMQTWTFEVFNDDGRKQLVSDYITSAAIFKLKQLAIALGRKDEFVAGTFQADDHVGATVRLRLKVEEQDGFDDKNRIVKIVPPSGVKAPAPAPARSLRPVRQPVTSPVSDEQQFQENDIPF